MEISKRKLEFEQGSKYGNYKMGIITKSLIKLRVREHQQKQQSNNFINSNNNTNNRLNVKEAN